MPWLPLATAPKSRPTAVAARIPASAAAHGFHPASTESLAAIEPGDAEQGRLGQGHHAAVAGQERQADRRDAQPQRGEPHLAGEERGVQQRHQGDDDQHDRQGAPRPPRVQARFIVPSRRVRSAAPRGSRRAGRR